MNWLKNWLKNRWLWAGIGIALVLVALGVIFGLNGNNSPQYKTAKVEKGTLVASVAASGTLSPVVSVQVGSQISGQIKELFADFNTEVKQGQLIAQIDPDTYEQKVRQAQADLDSARAQIMMQRAEASRYELNALNAKRDYERNQQLFEKGFISAGARDTFYTTYSAQVEQAKSAKAQVAVAEASLKQKQAVLAQAKVDLQRTAIRAPVDGIVIKRSVDRGQTVAASLQAPELFIIAENLTDMQVDTSVDESEIGRIREGQKATFTVDAFPGRHFEGSVKRIRKSAQTVSNVVTYMVELATANPDQLLLPGMTANVRIVTDTRDNVLRVPNAALRFRPTGSVAKSAAPAAASVNPAEQLKAQRERLDKELALTPEQKTKVDAIYGAMSEKLAVARNAKETDRKKQSDRVRAELREQIAAILTPEQKQKYDALHAESVSRRATSGTTTGRLYLLGSGGKPQEIAVRVGLTDGTMTEVQGADLKEGMEVIVGTSMNAGGAPTSARPPGPRMF